MIVLHAVDRKSSAIAISGILAALCLSLLYLKSISPVLDLSIYFIISLFPAVVLIETDHKYSWLFFAVISILSLVLPINKLELLYYYTFFGYYGIIKYYFEKYMKIIPSYIAKMTLFILILLFNYVVAASFIPAGAAELFRLPVLLIVATPLFFLYDYLYTLVINYYENNIRKRLRR
ncbi:MAG: hypothetical protein JXN10_11810 [Clostridia bacterium]|nr:hypothetical protein [Clostridia bacterium]